jgi:chemotaxis protein CheX
MNVKFLNPFVEAATEVLQVECQLNATHGNLSLQKSALTTDEITVMLSLIGEVQGVVLYGLSIPTALSLVSRMMGQEFSTFDNLAQSGIAELGNVITGRATIKMSQTGISANISPPTLILGNDISISTLDFGRIIVPLTFETGVMVVHLAIRETQAGQKDANLVASTVPAQGRD